MRSDKASKDASNGYLMEQDEIALRIAYDACEPGGRQRKLPGGAPPPQDEKAMADKISSSWDKVADLTLHEAKTTD